MLPIKNILCPTDFSAHSEAAYQLACALARDYGAHLTLLHVTVPEALPLVDGVMLPPATDEMPREARLLREWHPNVPHVEVTREIVEGNAVEEILEWAHEHPCDLIVLGNHGRNAFAKLLMGSTAEAVVRKAPCPVLTVKHHAPVHRELAEEEALHGVS